MLPSNNVLAVLINCFIASGEPSPRHLVDAAVARREGAEQQRGGR